MCKHVSISAMTESARVFGYCPVPHPDAVAQGDHTEAQNSSQIKLICLYAETIGLPWR